MRETAYYYQRIPCVDSSRTAPGRPRWAEVKFSVKVSGCSVNNIIFWCPTVWTLFLCLYLSLSLFLFLPLSLSVSFSLFLSLSLFSHLLKPLELGHPRHHVLRLFMPEDVLVPGM